VFLAILGVLLGILNLYLSTVELSITIPWVDIMGFNFSFTIDPLSQLFLIAIGSVTVFLFPYAYFYFKERRNRTLGILIVFLLGMMGSVTSSNLLCLFLFWELTSLTSFLLIGTDYKSLVARKAAMTALIVTGGGGVGLLVASISSFLVSGSLEFEAVAYNPYIVSGILLAALTKSAQFPFQFWLSGAMAAPTPISAYLHSATMVKLGVYLLWRFNTILPSAVLDGLVVIGAITLIITSLRAFFEEDFKKLLAYTTTAALGLLVSLVGKNAFDAAAVFFTAHVFYKGALFMLLGCFYLSIKSTKLSDIGSPFRFGFILGSATLISLLSLLGVPPILGFFGKEFILKDILKFNFILADYLLLVGVLLTVAVGFRVFKILFLSKNKELIRAFSPIVFTASALTIGSVTAPLFSKQLFGFGLWFGFDYVVVVSIAILILGWMIGFYSSPIFKSLTLVLSFENLGLFEKFLALCKKASHSLQPERTSSYLRATFLGVLIILFSQIPLPKAGHSLELSVPIVLASSLVFVGAIASCFVTSRISSILMVSLTGLGVTLFFAQFGAPDLAITQVLVEAVTLLLFALFISRLPAMRPKVRGTKQIWNIGIALGIGALMTIGVYNAGNNDRPLQNFFFDSAYSRAFGENVVNTILVDFRALDTFGEITVLALAALGVHALRRSL